MKRVNKNKQRIIWKLTSKTVLSAPFHQTRFHLVFLGILSFCCSSTHTDCMHKGNVKTKNVNLSHSKMREK